MHIFRRLILVSWVSCGNGGTDCLDKNIYFNQNILKILDFGTYDVQKTYSELLKGIMKL